MIVKPKVMPADPTRVCKTCGHYYPDLEVCAADDSFVTEADAKVRSCNNWEPRKEVPLQPDGSLKMKAKETIGAYVIGQGITSATLHTRHCGDCLHQDGDEMCPNPGEPFKEGCKNWEPKKEKSSGWDHQLEAKALDRGAKQGMNQEALDTVFAIACQQVPSMEQRWMELKAEISIMFAQKWAAEDMPE